MSATLSADGNANGTIDAGDYLGGDGNDVALFVSGLHGDFNSDGSVDGADYVVWRKNQGTMNTLPNDPHGGTIGANQFNTWRSNFGNTAGSGSGAGANAIPEPTTLVLLTFAAVRACIRRRRTACES